MKRLHINFLLITGLSILFSACNHADNSELITASGLKRADFQTVVQNDSTDLFVLRNKNGMEAAITNYGGRLVSLMVPDKTGKLRDVVLGFDNISDYTAQPSSYGATMGRVTNRIAYGQFVLDGDTIKLDKNNGQHTIHGGGEGWRQQVFKAKQPNDTTLTLTYLSPDGESGFPGNVSVQVTYTLQANNALTIRYGATTDKKTVINMTNHSFFNLSGDSEQSIMDDILYVNASAYTPIDTVLIPTGQLEPVAGTPFDFNHPLAIANGIARDSTNAQIKQVDGLDHNWVLNTKGDTTQLAASVQDTQTGILLNVYTSEPGIQVYTANSLNGTQKGKGNRTFVKYGAICLETQHYPDAPNQAKWPSVVLNPDDTYQSTCIYQFTTTP